MSYCEDSDKTEKWHNGSVKYNLESLSKYNLNQDVALRADKIYTSLNIGTYRKKNLKLLTFRLVVLAHNELGIRVNKKELATNVFEMTSSDRREANNKFSDYELDYKATVLMQDSIPSIFIRNMCINAGIIDDNEIKAAEEYVDQLYDKHKESFNDERPDMIAAVMLKYYLFNKGIEIPNKTFKKVTSFNQTSIKILYDELIKEENKSGEDEETE